MGRSTFNIGDPICLFNALPTRIMSSITVGRSNPTFHSNKHVMMIKPPKRSTSHYSHEDNAFRTWRKCVPDFKPPWEVRLSAISFRMAAFSSAGKNPYVVLMRLGRWKTSVSHSIIFFIVTALLALKLFPQQNKNQIRLFWLGLCYDDVAASLWQNTIDVKNDKRLRT